MRETSDTMQDLALAYGERNAMAHCINELNRLKNQANKDIMEKVFLLFGLEIIQRDLSFYLMNGVVSKEAGKKLTPTRHAIIKVVADKSGDLLDCLCIPKHALYAPIAGDYVKYNASPNYGEIIGAKL